MCRRSLAMSCRENRAIGSKLISRGMLWRRRIWRCLSKPDEVAGGDTVVLKGVIQRHAIRNPRLLQQLLHFVLDTSGSPLSAKPIADYLKSQNIRCSVDTILEYLAFFVDARMVSRISRHDLRGKRVLEVHEKYYAAVEVKAASTWRSKYSLGLKTLKNELAPREMRALGVFRGPVAAKYGGIEVLPVGEFLSRLWSGRVI